jgi:DNA-binding beta-propeller fold protein YncE
MKHSGMKFEALILIVVTLCGTSLLAGRAYSQSSGGPLPSAAVGASGTMVPTVIFANGFVWASVQNGQSASVVQISPETRSPTAVTLSLGLVDPIQMAYDTSNDNIWITDYSVSEISVVNVSATDAPQLVATISNPTVPYTWTIPPYKNVELASTPEGI